MSKRDKETLITKKMVEELKNSISSTRIAAILENQKLVGANIAKMAITPSLSFESILNSTNVMAEGLNNSMSFTRIEAILESQKLVGANIAKIAITPSLSFESILNSTNVMAKGLNNSISTIRIEAILKSQSLVAANIAKMSVDTSLVNFMGNVKLPIDRMNNLRDIMSEISINGTFSNEDELNVYEFEEALTSQGIDDVFQNIGFYDNDLTLQDVIETLNNHITASIEKNKSKLEITKKDIVLFCLINIVWGLFIVPWIQPMLNPYNEYANKKSTEIVNIIKNDIKTTNDVEEYKNIRIVKKDGLEVKITDKQNSLNIYTAHIGEIVEVVYKKRNWTKIRIYNGNIPIEGWVYTRYIEKIK